MTSNKNKVDLSGKTFFITGAAGFLGKKFIKSIANNNTKIILLLRDKKNRQGGVIITAEKRFNKIVEECGFPPQNATFIEGDTGHISHDVLEAGLQKAMKKLKSKSIAIVNIAASLSMDYQGQDKHKRRHTIAQNERTNIVGLKTIIKSISNIKIDGFFHYSTAYVHGKSKGILKEQQPIASKTNNSYEHTKREGEKLVAHWGKENPEIPVLILRPSIVTGEGTNDGYMAWINLMSQYVSLKSSNPVMAAIFNAQENKTRMADVVFGSMARLNSPFLPMIGNKNAIMDLIDVDDVNDYALLAISNELSSEKVNENNVKYLHLSNPHAFSLVDVSKETLKAFGLDHRSVNKLKFIPGLKMADLFLRSLVVTPVLGKHLKQFYQKTVMLRPYLMRHENTYFETKNTQEYFDSIGVAYNPKRIEEGYIKGLINHADNRNKSRVVATPPKKEKSLQDMEFNFDLKLFG